MGIWIDGVRHDVSTEDELTALLRREQPNAWANEDPVIRHLRWANTVAAIGYGISVGQQAINEVLHGGPKVLGEKPK